MKSVSDHEPLAVTLLGLSLAFSVGSIFGWFPHGVVGEWAWAYAPLPVSPALLAPVAIAATIIALYVLHVRAKLGLHAFLAASALLQLGFIASFSAAYPSGVTHAVAAIVHPDSTGYLQAALRYPELSELFAGGYVEALPQLPNHANTRLPGPLMVFWSAIEIAPMLGSGEWLAHVGVDTAALARVTHMQVAHAQAALLVAVFYLAATVWAVWPVHALARELADERVAAYVVPLWIFTPALGSFFPTFDPVYAGPAAAVLYSVVRGARTGDARHWIVASLWTVAGLFFTFAFVGLMAWAGFLYLGFALQRGELSVARWRDHARVFALYVGPIAVAYAALRFVGHIDAAAAFAQGMDVTGDVMARHSYFKWAFFFSWYDFFTFAGLLTSLFFMNHVFTALQTLRSGGGAKSAELATAFVSLSYCLTLLLQVLSGTVLAEIARLWVFFMPAVAVFAAQAIHRCLPEQAGLRLAVLGAAALQAFVFRWTISTTVEFRGGF